MALLHALRRTPAAIERNPVLFVPILVLALFQVPQLVLQSTSPGLATLLSLVLSGALVLVAPLVPGGLVGMADEALDGDTSLATFVAAGTGNYVSLLAVSLGLVALNVVVGVVASFVGVGVLFARYPGGAGDTTALVALLLAVLALVALAYLLVVFVVQFYVQAIVLDGRGAVGGLRRSAALVRTNLASVAGYSVVVGVLGALVGAAFGGASLVVGASSAGVHVPQLPVAGVVGVALVAVALAALLGGATTVFSVAFYRTLSA
jgi:hypothetical protein